MGTTDPRVDAYIDRAANFAKPILMHLRKVVHNACPDVEEAIKWGAPHFTYHGMLCHMAAFKQHCAFGFWKGALVTGPVEPATGEAMGQFGRIAALSDLPPDEVITAYIWKAMQLNEDGVKAPNRSGRKQVQEVEVPDDFLAALRQHDGAHTVFEAFSPSQQREYVDWITEAKSEATRKRRMDQAVEWISEGKRRNWKYERS